MNKNYLPSKQFVSRTIAIAIILAVILGIYEVARFFGSKPKLGSKSNLVAKSLISSQKDSNDNGIPDWEESLWGLNPEKNGPENKDFIIIRRASIAQDRPDLISDGPITENDALSRDFFTIVMSLQQGGDLDQSSVQAVGDAIGKKIIAEPIPDTYTRNMVKVVESTSKADSEYYSSYIQLVVKYADRNIGDELIFISQGLQNKDQNAIKQTKAVAEAYKAFGKEFLKIPVPNTLVAVHLSLANNYDKVGRAIDGLIDVLADPLTGIKSFINYKKYIDALTNDIDLLSGN